MHDAVASSSDSVAGGAWHAREVEETARRLGTDPARGLEPAEAEARLARDGPNELTEPETRGRGRILAEQFASVMTVLLGAAAAVSWAIGDPADAAAIAAILALNAALGYVQERKAEKALAALKRLAAPTVRAVRGGRSVGLPARELVRGDLVVLESGARVPADVRVVEAVGLRVDESALTGESEPSRKEASPDDAGAALGDRRATAYMGTVVVAGRGRALVTAVGMGTEVGRVAALLSAVEREPTPLQRQLAGLGRALAGAALGVVGAFLVLGLLRGEPARLMFLTAVSMAVAAVPEGLPAVVTVALALAAQRMLARKALIRRLPAVETLGAVTVICSDKTGTLTENRMSVAVLDAAGHRREVLESVREPKVAAGGDGGPGVEPELALLLAAGALCGDAFLEPEPDREGRWRAVGDPTEGALVAAAAALGVRRSELEPRLPRAFEVPFDSARKRMATVHRLSGPPPEPLAGALPAGSSGVVFVKGAAAAVLSACDRVWEGGRAAPLDPARAARVVAGDEELARRGMRVLGAAFRPVAGPLPDSADCETGLVFLGLTGLVDPPRPRAKEAVAVCRSAGIRPVMITGDHPLTALTVAEELGIGAGEVLTGADLDALDDAAFEEAAARVSVFARVAPEHKLRIVSALRRRGEVVAMTGDGVNDAPALKKADIGVAMGLAGTDVAKEAAGMVLLDDDFATIVAAVREGRVVYADIRKFVRYLIATNSGELWLMLLAPFLGLPLPLLPLQILWVNLVTDGLPALALGFEPAEPDAMSRPPRRRDARLVDGAMAGHVLWVGLLSAALALALGWEAWREGRPHWRTLVLAAVVCSQLGNALAVRSERVSVFSRDLPSNPHLWGAVLATAAAQAAVTFVPALNRALDTLPLSAAECGLAGACGAVVFAAAEVEKLLRRRARA